MRRPVTAAVVSWNTRELLRRCLTALGGEDVEVHVVDNGSTDGSRELVRSEFGAVTLHAPERNLGFGPAVNLVAARTQTPWLLVSNADTAPQPGAVAALLAAGAADPRAGALAPRLRLPDGSDQHSAYPFPTLPLLAAFNSGVAGRLPRLADRLCLEGHWDARRARRVPWAVGACLLVRREAWDAVGGFDPALWLYVEDLDLGWRLRRAGWHTRHVPDAVIDHESAASTRQAWGDARAERWQAETYAWLRRRRGSARARAAYALDVAGAAARVRLARDGWRRERARGWLALHRSAWRQAR